MRANRIVIDSPGPPAVLRYEPYDLAAPGPREVLIRQAAIGLNYIDIQHRTGRYPLPVYPSPIGTGCRYRRGGRQRGGGAQTRRSRCLFVNADRCLCR